MIQHYNFSLTQVRGEILEWMRLGFADRFSNDRPPAIPGNGQGQTTLRRHGRLIRPDGVVVVSYLTYEYLDTTSTKDTGPLSWRLSQYMRQS